ncbi:hypothetical protein M9458_028627, partial [Cirrhinus mrigala]
FENGTEDDSEGQEDEEGVLEEPSAQGNLDAFSSTFELSVEEADAEVEDEEEREDGGEERETRNQDSFSSTFESIVEQVAKATAVEEEEDDGEEDQDGFSSTFERIAGLAIAVWIHWTFEAPLTPLIQQRALMGPEPTELELETVQEGAEGEAELGTETARDEASSASPLRTTIPGSSIPNGFHIELPGNGESGGTMPNSI